MAEQKPRLVMDIVALVAATPPLKQEIAGYRVLLRRLRRARHSNRRAFYTLIVSVGLAVGLFAGSWLITSLRPSAPNSITRLADFPIYYPHPMPDGWSLDTSSITKQGNVVYFSLRSAQATIELSEQAEPENPPDLSKLTQTQQVQVPDAVSGSASLSVPSGFQDVSTPAGQSVEGAGPAGLPLAIVSTKSTLINLRGSDNSSSASLTEMVRVLHK